MQELSTISIILILVFSIQALGSAIFSAVVASTKGYDGPSWFFGGLFFGLPALIAIAGMPTVSLTSTKDKKLCPQCCESISVEAKVCRYCHYTFSVTELKTEIINDSLLKLETELKSTYPDSDRLKRSLEQLSSELELYPKIVSIFGNFNNLSSSYAINSFGDYLLIIFPNLTSEMRNIEFYLRSDDIRYLAKRTILAAIKKLNLQEYIPFLIELSIQPDQDNEIMEFCDKIIADFGTDSIKFLEKCSSELTDKKQIKHINKIINEIKNS